MSQAAAALAPQEAEAPTEPVSLEALEERLDALADGAPQSLLESIAAIGSRDALKALQSEFKRSEVTSTRAAVCASLGAFARPAIFHPSPDTERVAKAAMKFLAGACLEEDPHVSESAARALVRYKERASYLVESLIRKSSSRTVQAILARLLFPPFGERLSQKDVESIAHRYLVNVTSPSEDFADLLTRTNAKKPVPFLNNLYRDPVVDYHTRPIIIEAIGRLQTSEARESLLRLLASEQSYMLASVIDALATFDASDHLEALRPWLFLDDWYVPQAALLAGLAADADKEPWLEALGEWKNSEFISLQLAHLEVMQALANRSRALVTLESYLDSVQAALADPKPALRRSAFQQLAERNDGRRIELLFPLTEDSDEQLREDVIFYLRIKTGQDLWAYEDDWSEWWASLPEPRKLPRWRDAYRSYMDHLERRERRDISRFYGREIEAGPTTFLVRWDSFMHRERHRRPSYAFHARCSVEAGLDQLPDGTVTQVTVFGGEQQSCWPTPVALDADRRLEAAKFLASQPPIEGTDFYGALSSAYRDELPLQVMIATGAGPLGGQVEDPKSIQRQVKKLDRRGQVALHFFSYGPPGEALLELGAELGAEVLDITDRL